MKQIKPGDVIEITHPNFPPEFLVRTTVRAGEDVKTAIQRAYMIHKVDCAFGGYRPGTGKVHCV